MRKSSYYHRGVEIDDAVLTASEQEVSRMEFRLNKMWLRVLFGGIIIACVLIAFRITDLMVRQTDDYHDRAMRNATRYDIIPAPRGRIFDINDAIIADNVPQIDLIAVLDLLPRDDATRATIVQTIANILGVTTQSLYENISQAQSDRHHVAILARKITREHVFAIEEARAALPGVRTIATAQRYYADPYVFSHVIGYTGAIQKSDLDADDHYFVTDDIGKTGVEKTYEKLLRGTHGWHAIEVNARGTMQRVAEDRVPVAGEDLHLTLDAGLQKTVHTIVEKYIQNVTQKRAAVIAVDPRDGSVRALVSYPGYDNNLFAQGVRTTDYAALAAHPDQPLFNRVLAGAYAPGSTVKPLLAGAALTEGVIDEHTRVMSTGSITVGGTRFGDWRVNGIADVRRAIAVSHDIFFYAIGGGYDGIRGMGMDRMKSYYTRFGFGEKSGIDIPGEVAGFIPDPAWKRDTYGEKWYIGNDYHAAIGQGYITATPLQIVMATAAIANGGTLWQPHLLASHTDAHGATYTTTAQARRDHLLSPEVLRIVQEGMRMTVTEGTAQSLQRVPVAVAGKTGTAQFGAQGFTHAWFAAYAPYENPELALVVLAEGIGPHDPSIAVPIAREIFTWYFGGRPNIVTADALQQSPQENH